eukprot:3176311-Rhodomonas_salina.2
MGRPAPGRLGSAEPAKRSDRRLSFRSSHEAWRHGAPHAACRPVPAWQWLRNPGSSSGKLADFPIWSGSACTWERTYLVPGWRGVSALVTVALVLLLVGADLLAVQIPCGESVNHAAAGGGSYFHDHQWHHRRVISNIDISILRLRLCYARPRYITAGLQNPAITGGSRKTIAMCESETWTAANCAHRRQVARRKGSRDQWGVCAGVTGGPVRRLGRLGKVRVQSRV